VDPVDHYFFAASRFCFTMIHDPFLTPYTLSGQFSSILRLTISFLSRKMNAFLLTFSSLHMSLMSSVVSLQLFTERRVVLLEPVSSGVLMKIRIIMSRTGLLVLKLIIYFGFWFYNFVISLNLEVFTIALSLLHSGRLLALLFV